MKNFLKTPKFWQNNNLISMLLTPFSWLYLLGHKINQQRQVPQKFNKKLICIGNITAGGAGKTPLTIAIAKLLQKNNFKIAFASKNYIGSLDYPKMVNRTTDTACQVSDEPLLLAAHASSFVAKHRVEAVRLAAASDAQITLIDDGLQNNCINADVKILVVDAAIKFGNKKLLPAGPLREPLNAISKVDFIVQIGGDKNSIPELVPYQNKLFIANAVYKPNLNLKQKYLAFTGIAYPSKFFNALVSLGLHITKQVSFADHYLYSKQDIAKLNSLAKRNDSILITTEKDYVRINQNWQRNIKTLKMDLWFDDEKEFFEQLKNKLTNK